MASTVQSDQTLCWYPAVDKDLRVETPCKQYQRSYDPLDYSIKLKVDSYPDPIGGAAQWLLICTLHMPSFHLSPSHVSTFLCICKYSHSPSKPRHLPLSRYQCILLHHSGGLWLRILPWGVSGIYVLLHNATIHDHLIRDSELLCCRKNDTSQL